MTLETLRYLCSTLGIRTLPYDVVMEDIAKRGFTHKMLENDAFCTVLGFKGWPSKTIYHILYDGKLNERDIVRAVSKELGHIVLGHLTVYESVTAEMMDAAWRFAELMMGENYVDIVADGDAYEI